MSDSELACPAVTHALLGFSSEACRCGCARAGLGSTFPYRPRRPDTFEGRLDLEPHGGRAFEGVAVRKAQRVRAMTSFIWHNHETGAAALRSLTAFDQ